MRWLDGITDSMNMILSKLWELAIDGGPGMLQSMASQTVKHNLVTEPSLNYGGGNEDNCDLVQKVPWKHCYTQCPLPAAGHHWPRPPLETPGHSWASLSQSLWGHCFFLWGPGTYKVLFVPSKILFPQCCVSLGSSVMGTSSKRAYAIPSLLHPEPPPLRQSTADAHLLMRHSDSSVSVPVVSLGPGVHKACLSLLSISGGHWVWF